MFVPVPLSHGRNCIIFQRRLRFKSSTTRSNCSCCYSTSFEIQPLDSLYITSPLNSTMLMGVGAIFSNATCGCAKPTWITARCASRATSNACAISSNSPPSSGITLATAPESSRNHSSSINSRRSSCSRRTSCIASSRSSSSSSSSSSA